MFAGDCSDGDIRLVGGRDEFEGRVEICIGGFWGPVCGSSGWDVNDALVVCRQLGFLERRDDQRMHPCIASYPCHVRAGCETVCISAYATALRAFLIQDLCLPHLDSSSAKEEGLLPTLWAALVQSPTSPSVLSAAGIVAALMLECVAQVEQN